MMRVLALVAVAAAVMACKKGPKPPVEQPVVTGGAQTHQVATPGVAPRTAQGEGEQQPIARVPSTCPEGKVVSSGDMSTPEGTLFLAYKAALKGDAGGGFDEFFALFLPEKNREDIKRSIWANVLKYVSKYTAGPEDPTFVACRFVPMGNDRVKVFVRCNDPQKSDPPVVLERGQDGNWRIDVMTP